MAKGSPPTYSPQSVRCDWRMHGSSQTSFISRAVPRRASSDVRTSVDGAKVHKGGSSANFSRARVNRRGLSANLSRAKVPRRGSSANLSGVARKIPERAFKIYLRTSQTPRGSSANSYDKEKCCHLPSSGLEHHHHYCQYGPA